MRKLLIACLVGLVTASFSGVSTAAAPAKKPTYLLRFGHVMTDQDVQAIAARTDLFSGVTGIMIIRGNVTVQSQARTLTVIGVMENYGTVRKNMRILRGRFIDEDDVRLLLRLDQ